MKKVFLLASISFVCLISFSQQNVGIGTNTPLTKLDVKGALALREGVAITVTSPGAHGGANDNITLPDITGTGDVASFYHITTFTGTAGAFSIYGIVPNTGAYGQVVTIINATGKVMTIVNNNSSTAANSIYTPAGANLVDNATTGTTSSITLQYSQTAGGTGNPGWVVTATENYIVPSGTITTNNVLAGGSSNAVTITNGTGQVVGGSNLTVSVAKNALGQDGVVPGTASPANNNEVWGTNGSGVPAWGSVSNAQLANSTISGVSLGGNLSTLTIGTGLSGTSYNGSSPVTIANTGVLSITGTTNQVNASASTGAVTLSLPQNINTAATPTFSTLTVNGANTNDIIASSSIEIGSTTASATGNAGAIQYTGGTLEYSNGTSWLPLTTGGGSNYWTLSGSNLYNNSGTNVGIGTASPSVPFEVVSSATPTELRISSAYNGYGQAKLSFVSNKGNVGATEWRPGYIISQDGNGGGQYEGRLDFYTNGVGSANAYGSVYAMSIMNGNVGIGTTTPNTQFSNTSTNILGTDGAGVSANSVAWANSAAGYNHALYNGSTATNADGLAVKVASTNAATRILDLSTGTSQASSGTSVMAVFGNGYVGIGTTAPTTPLMVAAGATDLLRLESTTGGSGNNAFINFATYGNTGVGARIGAVDLGGCNDGLVFHVSNAGSCTNTATNEAMRIINTGYVGIGTTTPQDLLDVSGVINSASGYRYANTNQTTGYYLRSNGTNFVPSAIQASDLSAGISGTTGYHAKFTGTNTIGNSSVIYESGNYLGINYTSPISAISFNNSGTNNITWGAGPYTAIYDNGNIHYWTDDQTNFESGSTGSNAKWLWTVGQTATASNTGTTWMELVNGELGIGTTSPGNLLDVEGGNIDASGYVSAGGTAGGALMFGGTTAVNGSGSGGISFSGRPRMGDWGQWLTLGEPNGTNSGLILQIVGTGGSPRIGIFTGTSSSLTASPTLRNCLDNGSGYVGIGTTSPGYPLDVETQLTTSYSGYGYLNGSGNTGYGSGSSGSVGLGIHSAGRITCPEFDAISDRRIKTNIRPVPSGSMLDKANALRVVNYNYIDKLSKGNAVKTGFIAQEVEAVMPDVVRRGSDVIPSVFTAAEKVQMENSTLTITTPVPHGFAAGDDIRLYDKNNTMYEVKVADVKGDKVFTVNNWTGPADSIFVYGKKVNDFRTVDFDQITAVSIGAVQELDKKVNALEEENDRLQCRNEELENMLNAMQSGKADAGDVAQLKLQLEELKMLMQKNGIRSER